MALGCGEAPPTEKEAPQQEGALPSAPVVMDSPEALKPYREVLPVAGLQVAGGKAPPRVTFINPGRKDETFWTMVTDFMRAVVQDVPIELEILTAERDHILMKDMVKVVCAREPKPDYLLLVDEKDTGEAMLRTAQQAGVKTFMVLNPLSKEPRERVGAPRAKLDTWIGALVVDQERAGYDIGQALLKRARLRYPAPESLPALAISGNQSTTAAVERNRGLARALKEDGAAPLQQTIFSQWRRDKAQRQAAGLLRRYPGTRLIWAANDDMALGGLEAARGEGFRPGETVFVGGLNWAVDALEEVSRGQMVTSVGGHFMGGGWALVMLFDHHHGRDFAEPDPVRMLIMGTIDAEKVGPYLDKFGDKDWGKVDFTGFSRVLNPDAAIYDFSLDGLIRHTGRSGP